MLSLYLSGESHVEIGPKGFFPLTSMEPKHKVINITRLVQ